MTDNPMTGQALSVLHMIVETRELLFRVHGILNARNDEMAVLQADAWQTINARFQLVVSALADPDYLLAQEDLLTEYGLEGPEVEFRRAQFDRVTSCCQSQQELAKALQTSESILRSLSNFPTIGPTTHAIADFIAATAREIKKPLSF